MTDQEAAAYIAERLNVASNLLGRSVEVSEDRLLEHYRNRGALPLVIQENLSEEEVGAVSRGIGVGLEIDSSYTRYYPHGETACHVLGYVGRKAPLSTKPIENMDNIFPEEEGRDGLELTFDNFLSGTGGIMNLTLDEDGEVVSERIERAPIPGNNIVTTIDLDIQKHIEKSLAESGRNGSVVLIDPSSGDILAMASRPSFDPNIFSPLIDPVKFKDMSEDPDAPLFCRGYKGAYPPGSTFKTFIGLCGLQTGVISPDTQLSCPSALKIGNIWFNNHESADGGRLDFNEALARSCNTWFYQLGLKLGDDAIVAMARIMGFGQRTGIPLRGENLGSLPDKDNFFKKHGRRLSIGDVANMSIGQGDVQTTPLQMARAMGIIASGGKIHQTRLVKQVQSIDNSVVAAYPTRTRGGAGLRLDNLDAVARALVRVTASPSGTGTRAGWSKKIKVAGKTGTAQRMLNGVKRNVAWFAGFAPADNPQYAFAVALEGRAGEEVSGGKTAAPVAKRILSHLLKDYSPPDKTPKNETSDKNKAGGETKKSPATEQDSPETPMVEAVEQAVEELVGGDSSSGRGSDVGQENLIDDSVPEIRPALPVMREDEVPKETEVEKETAALNSQVGAIEAGDAEIASEIISEIDLGQ
jgi:penicillin-binding protein 2